MKRFFSLLFIFTLLMAIGQVWAAPANDAKGSTLIAVADTVVVEKLTMTPEQWEAYKVAREAKDWVKCEELTVFPDVKAWDALNQGVEKFYLPDYTGVKADFERALSYADQAEKVGRAGKGKNSMERLRLLIIKATDSIAEVEKFNTEKAAKKSSKK